MCAPENTGLSILRCFLWMAPYVPRSPGPRSRRTMLLGRQIFYVEGDAEG